MKILTTILARGGSKRVPYKNIRNIGGKPVILYTLDILRTAGLTEELIISTEDERVADVIRKSDYKTNLVLRPVDLAQDKTSSMEVLNYILSDVVGSKTDITHVLNIPPTASLIKTEDLQKAITKAEASISNSIIIGVKPFNVPFESSYVMGDEGRLTAYQPEGLMRPTQEFQRHYYDAGMFALIPADIVRGWPNTSTSYTERMLGIEVTGLCIDVDEEQDWADLVTIMRATLP